MTIGASLLLIAVGAILKYATDVDVSGVNIDVVGVILMVVGIVGLVLSLILAFAVDDRRGGPPRDLL